MNELLFSLHVLIVVAFGWGALRLGAAALTAWAAIQSILANLFVLKQIDFFGFHITCSDVFAIGGILGINLLREFYGKTEAKKALWICFFSMLFFTVMAQVHLLYQPNTFDTTQTSFKTLLSPAPRLMLASLAVFFIVQQIDLRLYNFLKERCTLLNLPLRNGISLLFTQSIDTVLFSVFGLWGWVVDLFDIILVSFLIKVIIISLISLFLPFFKRFFHVYSTK